MDFCLLILCNIEVLNVVILVEENIQKNRIMGIVLINSFISTWDRESNRGRVMVTCLNLKRRFVTRSNDEATRLTKYCDDLRNNSKKSFYEIGINKHLKVFMCCGHGF